MEKARFEYMTPAPPSPVDVANAFVEVSSAAAEAAVRYAVSHDGKDAAKAALMAIAMLCDAVHAIEETYNIDLDGILTAIIKEFYSDSCDVASFFNREEAVA